MATSILRVNICAQLKTTERQSVICMLAELLYVLRGLNDAPGSDCVITKRCSDAKNGY